MKHDFTPSEDMAMLSFLTGISLGALVVGLVAFKRGGATRAGGQDPRARTRTNAREMSQRMKGGLAESGAGSIYARASLRGGAREATDEI